MTPDEPSHGQIAAEAVQAFSMPLMQGRTLNQHVECERSVTNATLAAQNAEGWSLVGQPTIIGSHVDMWFEKTVYEEAEAAAEAVAEPSAEANPADEIAAGTA